MDIIYKKLLEIKQQPASFLGETSLQLLNAYINGYWECQEELNCDFKTSIRFFPDFQEYVQKYYGVNFTTQSWVKIIISNCRCDVDAFNKFYELLDKFLEEHYKMF